MKKEKKTEKEFEKRSEKRSDKKSEKRSVKKTEKKSGKKPDTVQAVKAAEAGKKEKKKKPKEKKTGEKRQLIEGRLMTNRKGFGFVESEELSEDIFVSHSHMNGAFHQDRVLLERIPSRSGKGAEGRIVKILERGIQQLVGTYRRSRGFGFVVPDNAKIADDIHIMAGAELGAADGEKVVVKISGYGNERQRPEGKVIEVLGPLDEAGVDILSVIRSHELPMEFEAAVLDAAQALPYKVTGRERRFREDLRDWQMVTIDGEDSKDLDDAVSLTSKGNDYILGVHIADVSHYVKEGEILDREALERGSSVYLADRVIPMLPVKLSNGICSLNEGEDRLAMSCIMRIGKNGVIREYRICESVINVDRRMTYHKVADILKGEDKALLREYKPFVKMFKKMHELSLVLKGMRTKRGAIDFDLPESKIILDENGKVTDIKAYERNAATAMIEQFMLSANECVAAYMLEKELPFLYRIHETPDADRMTDLLDLLRSFGYHVKGDPSTMKPKEVQKLLAETVGRPEEALIRSLALRSMKQARYSTECLGHFGLAVKEYTHFTSPIRRYPDLQIHRILKEELHGKLKKKRIAHYEALLEKVARQSSERERRAAEAERDVDRLKMAEYMEAHLGEEFEGVISGVTGWGMYVALPNTVEGMVPIAKIPGDEFDYSREEYALVGRFSARRYRLGESIRVRVASVDLLLHTIDFSIVPKDKGEGGKHEKRRNKTRRK